ncbi:hypothetical protein HMPREF3136_03825 [Neisseria sp. HMSC15C08]|nr:hypothetical protein HMPREF3136_03825 [Neisseria sp. HMSC15C08]
MTEMVKLQAPEGFTDVSFGSQSYTVGEDRIVEVPAEAAQFLYQFGFGNVASEPAEPEKAETKRGRKAKTEQAAEAVEPVEAEQAETEQPAETEKAE